MRAKLSTGINSRHWIRSRIALLQNLSLCGKSRSCLRAFYASNWSDRVIFKLFQRKTSSFFQIHFCAFDFFWPNHKKWIRVLLESSRCRCLSPHLAMPLLLLFLSSFRIRQRFIIFSLGNPNCIAGATVGAEEEAQHTSVPRNRRKKRKRQQKLTSWHGGVTKECFFSNLKERKKEMPQIYLPIKWLWRVSEGPLCGGGEESQIELNRPITHNPGSHTPFLLLCQFIALWRAYKIPLKRRRRRRGGKGRERNNSFYSPSGTLLWGEGGGRYGKLTRMDSVCVIRGYDNIYFLLVRIIREWEIVV